MTDAADHAGQPRVGHGNPRGRPKGQRNLTSEIERVMAMPVPVTVTSLVVAPIRDHAF